MRGCTGGLPRTNVPRPCSGTSSPSFLRIWIAWRTVIEPTANSCESAELARDHIQTGSEFIVMRRDHKWKIVVYLDDTYGELYDLSKDPGEVRNLWDDPAHREMRAELAKSCLAWVAKGMLQASRRPSRKPQQPMKI